MSKKTVISFSIFVLIVIGFIAYYIYDQTIPKDPSDHGNTASNLHNNGLFFEMDGKVYFANSSDGNCLYSMNVDESEPKRLTCMGVKYISGAHNMLYFYMDSTKKSTAVTGLGTVSNQYGIYRCRTNGSKQTCLHRDFCGEVQLCGEYIYYQVRNNGGVGGSLYKIGVDKKHRQEVAKEFISPVCYDNGFIYFTGVTNDHSIHIMNTKQNDTISDAIYGFYFFPVVQSGYLYYLNGESNYSLWRTNLRTGQQELVTSERLDCYAINDQYIYYSFSNADAPALKRCNLDGSNKVVLFDGVVNSINLTSRYVYFKVFGNDTATFHIPIDGSAPASTFDIGKQK